MSNEQPKPHDVRRDYAGYGGHLRYTCYNPDCTEITCLRQPYMSDAQWEEAKAKFFAKHPCPMDQIKKA